MELGPSLKKHCKHCKSLISREATRCPQCGGDLRVWPARHWFLTILLVIFVGIPVGAGIADGINRGTNGASSSNAAPGAAKVKVGGSQNVTPTVAPAPEKKQNIVDVGQPLTVGSIRITTGAPQKQAQFNSDNQFIDPAVAKGVYVLIPITIENVGSSTVSFTYDQVILVDGLKRTFESSTSDWNLSMVLGADKLLSYEKLNPNVPISKTVVFDIPANATSVALMVGNDSYNADQFGFVRLGF
ncbi:MAG: DUF4352 domain-containing protein [Thermoleophilia bacterium]